MEYNSSQQVVSLPSDGRCCDALIPTHPPKEAIEARRKAANQAGGGDHYHTVANPAKGEAPGERGAEPAKAKGYRPGRATQTRQQGKKKPRGE